MVLRNVRGRLATVGHAVGPIAHILSENLSRCVTGMITELSPQKNGKSRRQWREVASGPWFPDCRHVAFPCIHNRLIRDTDVGQLLISGLPNTAVPMRISAHHT